MSIESREPRALLEAVARGDKTFIADALAIVEDTRAATLERRLAVLDAIEVSSPRRAWVLGVTGPPGVGKSSLVRELVRALRARGLGVGVVAVDPSSDVSRGALLGDRARLDASVRDAQVFVRSVATQGALGGLSDAAPSIVAVLAHAYDVVLVETTGVGQTELDVREVADRVAFVVQPGSGDALQFSKAGVTERPDVFIVQKGDLGALAEATRGELERALSLRGRVVGGEAAPVFVTSAETRVGIDAVVAWVISERDAEPVEATRARRQEANVARACRELERVVGRRGVERLGGRHGVIQAVIARLAERVSVERAVAELAAR